MEELDEAIKGGEDTDLISLKNSYFLEIDLYEKKFQEWEDGVSWKFDSCYIVLVQTESRFQEIPYHRCRTGLNHLAFHAQSKLQVDQMTEKLRDRGIKILYQDLHPYAGGKDYYAVFFEDPDRMKLELVAP